MAEMLQAAVLTATHLVGELLLPQARIRKAELMALLAVVTAAASSVGQAVEGIPLMAVVHHLVKSVAGVRKQEVKALPRRLLEQVWEDLLAEVLLEGLSQIVWRMALAQVLRLAAVEEALLRETGGALAASGTAATAALATSE